MSVFEFSATTDVENNNWLYHVRNLKLSLENFSKNIIISQWNINIIGLLVVGKQGTDVVVQRVCGHFSDVNIHGHTQSRSSKLQQRNIHRTIATAGVGYSLCYRNIFLLRSSHTFPTASKVGLYKLLVFLLSQL